MYLELQEKEAFEEIKAFSLTLNFDSKEDLSEEPVFKFGSDFKGEKVSVHEERYNEEDQTMKLYVAGRDTVLEKGEKVREVSLYTMRDKVVQTSIAQELHKIYEPRFSNCVYAYRSNRSAMIAAEKIEKEILSGQYVGCQNRHRIFF